MGHAARVTLGTVLLLAACSRRGGDGGGGPGGEGGPGDVDGGPTACIPGRTFCDGNDVRVCDADGEGSTVSTTCTGHEACSVGVCINACDAARADRSNVGCEYWAVDLDNEFYSGLGLENDAAGAQFAVAIANPSDVTVRVIVDRNDGPPGGTLAPATIADVEVAPQGLVEIPLPQREVDGSVLLRDDGPGTFLSSNAYRITTNYPVVAYQFNPIEQQFSNDASLLIPTTGLDTHYRVLGWPTTNPIALPGLMVEGIPDHSFVTIVGVLPDTHVSVTLGGPIVGGGGIPATAAGEVVTATLGPFDVLNLESDMIPGDLTGTVVTSDREVAVWSGGERGAAPYDTTGIPEPPGGATEELCCTDHLEEQVFPTTSWGRDFVISRSPVRSADASWSEPDIYRVMAHADGTTITTNLPAPFDAITLGAGEWRELWSQRSFVLRASAPISIEQILVSQAWVGDWRPGHGGDPSMLLFAPYEQFREHYVVLTPTSWTASYLVVSMPESTTVLLDGRDIRGDEFMAICTYETAGDIDGAIYLVATCPVSPGTHRVDGSVGVGVMVYGYYAVGSYGYAGGSNLTRITLI